MSDTELDNLALTILDTLTREAQGIWSNRTAKYTAFRGLQIDKRGSFGERFFTQALTSAYPRRLDVKYNDGDQGEWDLKFNGLKIEVKTSSLGADGKKFQNEGIKEDVEYDGVMFLGVSPDKLYIKFVAKEHIPFEILHNRGSAGTGVAYKWDFKPEEMIEVSSIEDIKQEFEKNFPGIIR